VRSLLAKLNLARAIILFSLVGALVLAWRGWTARTELRDLEDSLDREIPRLVEEIQKASADHSRLAGDMQGDAFLRQRNLESYILQMASKPDVAVGDLKTTPDEDVPMPGVTDEKYRIQPKDRARQYTRTQIANFMYYLEAESRRVKVTSARVELVGSKVKPHEVPPDSWSFELEVTSRQRSEAPQPAGG
jgi:hypothetical protein